MTCPSSFDDKAYVEGSVVTYTFQIEGKIFKLSLKLHFIRTNGKNAILLSIPECDVPEDFDMCFVHRSEGYTSQTTTVIFEGGNGLGFVYLSTSPYLVFRLVSCSPGEGGIMHFYVLPDELRPNKSPVVLDESFYKRFSRPQQ